MEGVEDNTAIRTIGPHEESREESAQSDARSGVQVTEYKIPPQPQRLLSRRNFLKLAAGASAIGIGTYFGINLFRNQEERRSVNTIEPRSEPVSGEFLGKFRNERCFNEDSAQTWMQEQGISSEEYGKIAAAGVTLLSLKKKDSDTFSTSEGTGGIVEINGARYIATTRHVLDMYLDERANENALEKPRLLVNIPGTNSMYERTPESIHSYARRVEADRDIPVFIKIEGKLATEVDGLVAENKLSPLTPIPYDPNITPEVSQLRFQGGSMALETYNHEGEDFEAQVAREMVVGTSGQALMCSGNSGAVALHTQDKRLTGRYVGHFTHGIEHTSEDGGYHGFTSDALGVMGGSNGCSIAAYVTSFGSRNFASGLNETRLM